MKTTMENPSIMRIFIVEYEPCISKCKGKSCNKGEMETAFAQKLQYYREKIWKIAAELRKCGNGITFRFFTL